MSKGLLDPLIINESFVDKYANTKEVVAIIVIVVVVLLVFWMSLHNYIIV